MDKLPSVYIIILNWNRLGDTLSCLESIETISKTGFDLHVLVVDNGSTDGSVETLKKYKGDGFILSIIENRENLGFAAGNNIGIEYAIKEAADFLLVLNNDTLVDKNLLKEFLVAAKKYPQVGIFTPKIYFAKGFEFKKKYKEEDLGKVIWSAGGDIDWNNVYATNRHVDEVDSKRLDKDTDSDFATGAAMFLRAEVVKKYGNFDERYFMYFEDVDLCERYKRVGGKIMYVSKCRLWHKVAQSSGIGSDLNDYFISRNRLLFGMGYAPLRTKMALYKESVKFLLNGRVWQKKGVVDFYTANFGKGSWKFK
jgi:hypothetical protein